eukprot:3027431-Amphidinium_carterae.4
MDGLLRELIVKLRMRRANARVDNALGLANQQPTDLGREAWKPMPTKHGHLQRRSLRPPPRESCVRRMPVPRDVLRENYVSI